MAEIPLFCSVGILCNVEWCILQFLSSSIISYNFTSIPHNHHTHIYLKHTLIGWHYLASLRYLTQYYLSFPIPNDLAKSFCETIAYWEKGTVSVEDAEKRAQQAADALLAELGADDDIGAGAVKSKTSKKSKGKKKI